MKSKKTKLPKMEVIRYGCYIPYIIIGDDGDQEVYCDHGVGHGFNVHTCDGTECCKKALETLRRLQGDKVKSRTKRTNRSVKRTTSKKK